MGNEKISLLISFESLVTAIQSLNLDQLLEAREYIGTLIEQAQDEAGEDKLISESEVDYSFLQELLAEGAWEEADEETVVLMLEVAKRGGLMSVNAAENFPISDLKTIDQLWVKYSNGRFGLSVQEQIWQEVGKDVEKFGEIVGWRSEGNWIQENNLKFTCKVPVGHLPFVRSGLRYGVEIWPAEYFTDSDGDDRSVETAEPVESIEMWEVFADLLANDRHTAFISRKPSVL